MTPFVFFETDQATIDEINASGVCRAPSSRHPAPGVWVENWVPEVVEVYKQNQSQMDIPLSYALREMDKQQREEK